MKMKIITDELSFMNWEETEKLGKIIENLIGKMKKEGKIHLCSTPRGLREVDENE